MSVSVGSATCIPFPTPKTSGHSVTGAFCPPVERGRLCPGDTLRWLAVRLACLLWGPTYACPCPGAPHSTPGLAQGLGPGDPEYTDGRTPWALLYSDVQVLLWGCYVRDTLGLWFWTLGDLDKDVNDFSLKRLVWA